MEISTTTTIILVISLSLSGLIWYSERSRFLHKKRVTVSIVFFLIGLAYLLISNSDTKSLSLEVGFFSTPLVVAIILGWADLYSLRFHGREFQFHARGARTMKGLGLKKHNSHYSLSDKVFSSLLILITLLWAPIVAAFNLWLS